MATALAPPAPPAPLSTATYRLSAANAETAAAVLRDLVVALLHTTGHAALTDDARLCTSELVTNVYRHTDTRLVHLDVQVHERHVTVWVHDDQPRDLPAPRLYSDELGGLGLSIVNRTARSWGTAPYGGLVPVSKAVWFRLEEEAPSAS